MTTLAGWVYRALLWLTPPDFRREHGQEAAALFRRSLAEGRARRVAWRALRVVRGWWGVVQVAAAEWADVLRGSRTRDGGWGVVRSTSLAAAQAVRSIKRAPAISLGVVALLGLGIGATTTVLSVVDGVLVRPLPYPEADRLLMVDQGAHSWPDFLDWREHVAALEPLVAGSGFSLTLAADVLQDIEGARVSAGFFGLFGATAAIGRLPTDAELEAKAPVAVVSYAAWERRWGSDPGLVGRTLTLNGSPIEVVGVLAADFVPPRPVTGSADVFLALDESMELALHDRSWTVVGRLRPGASIDQARVELRERAEAGALTVPEVYLDQRGELARTFPPVSLQEAIAGDARAPLIVLLVGASLLMLVAVGNATSLMLARAAARRGELAIRRTLGAGRALAGQLLLESLMLSLAGAAVGLGVAVGGLELIQAFDPGDIPRVDAIRIDIRVAGLAALLALVAGLGAGLVPAIRSGQVAPASMLRRAGGRGRMAGSAGRGLVVAEAALASLLLVGSMTVVHGLRDLLQSDPGFSPESRWTASINVGRDASEADRAATAERIRDRLATLPGVRAVGAGVTVPFQISGGSRCCWWGSLTFEEQHIPELWVHPVTPGYFSAVGIPLQAGREFTPDDPTEGVIPIVLNHLARAALFGDDDPVGRPLRFEDQELVVAGVIQGVQHWGADQDVESAFYVPYDAMGTWASGLTFVLHSAVAPQRGEVVGAVSEVAPGAIVSEVGTMTTLMADSLARQRFYTMILSVFALVALILAMAGLGGTLLYDARRRRHELGVRMALGAPAAQMARSVLRGALTTVALGAVLGLIAYLPLRRFTESVVPGVDTIDPTTLAVFALLLTASVLVASWIPARLVAATDPVRALRGE